jgi:phage N-6-adenine-methyltransferase
VSQLADLFPQVGSNPDDTPDERYTLPETLAWCRAMACVDAFDLDVAACAESHCAARWYAISDDGLKQPWSGRVFCNPPFSDIGPWVEKAWEVITSDHGALVAMLLPATRTDQRWWQEHVEPFRDSGPQTLLRTYFLPGRTRFGFPGNPKGVGVGSPPFGCVLLVFKAFGEGGGK